MIVAAKVLKESTILISASCMDVGCHRNHQIHNKLSLDSVMSLKTRHFSIVPPRPQDCWSFLTKPIGQKIGDTWRIIVFDYKPCSLLDCY